VVQPIQVARPEETVGHGQDALLGLALPTHGFTAPWAVLRFTLRLPRRRGTHALVVATRAGTKLGPWFLPGMEGTAAYLLALILWRKGYRLRGVLGLDMPSNWLALHPGLHPDTVRAIVARAETKLGAFMDAVLSGRRQLRGWISLCLGLLLAPLSLAYMLLGRFYLAKFFFASERCTGCGLCARHCPNGGVKLWRGRPYWTLHCESCMRCMAYCPTQAVEAGHSWALLLYWLTTVPAVTLALDRLTSRWPGLSVLRGGAPRLALDYVYALVAMTLAYALFSLALRVPWVNRLFTCTTLTHYYRRYHEPDTALNDME
jgi:ferredoxin